MFIKLKDFKKTIIDLNNVSIIQTDYKDFTISTKDGKMVYVEYGSSDKKEADLKLIGKALGVVDPSYVDSDIEAFKKHRAKIENGAVLLEVSEGNWVTLGATMTEKFKAWRGGL